MFIQYAAATLNPMDSSIAILIVANDPLARAGLAALLAAVESLTVLGQTGQADLEAAVDTYDPDAIVWDVGWDAQLPALDIEDLPPIVALVTDEDGAVQAIAQNISGVLARTATPEQIAAALDAVLHGLVVLDPTYVAQLATETSSNTDLPDPLTERELDVLHLIAEGQPNKAIAEQLYISQNTVKFHLNAIMQKLDAHNRTEAAVKAARLGVIRI